MDHSRVAVAVKRDMPRAYCSNVPVLKVISSTFHLKNMPVLKVESHVSPTSQGPSPVA
jgi:hypothetical protein